MLFFKKTLPVLLAVFLLSVLIRLPQLGRPMADHHESATAMLLRTLTIWDETGLKPYFCNLVMSYEGETNKYINNQACETSKMTDNKGNLYYVSHPPFAYYFPYFLMKAFRLKPSVAFIQTVNLCLHFLSALFVYFTVLILSLKQARNNLHFSSFVAYCIYVFMPTTLWFQGNVYMSDMAVQLPYIIGVYIVLKMILRQKFYNIKYQLFYALVLSIMLYTSWLGLFFVIGVLIYALIHLNRISGFKILIANTILVSFFILRLISFQYAQINGLMAFIEEFVTKYIVQGSLADVNSGYFQFVKTYLYFFKTLFYNYLLNYLPFYILLVVFFIFSFSKAKMKIIFTENGYRFLWLSVLPIVLLHLVLLNYSRNDYTTLYASLFFAVMAGVVYDKIKKSGTVNPVKLNMAYLALIVFMLLQYTIMNLPGEKSWSGKKYAMYKEDAANISHYAMPDEVLFSYAVPSPELIYYTHRNILPIKNEKEAYDFLQNRKLKKGVIIGDSTNPENFINFKKISIE